MAQIREDSEVHICNLALGEIPHRPIADIDQEHSKAARLCRQFYAEVRDECLSEYPWNFSTRRVTLVLDATAPLYGFDYAYKLAGDHLRVFEVDGLNEDDWTVENTATGKRLYTNLGAPLYAKVAVRIDTPGSYDATFTAYFAAALAQRLAPGLTRSAAAERKIAARVDELRPRAKRIDATESRTRVGHPVSAWLQSRRIP